MFRTISAALLCLCGLASSASAQYHTGYYHAPPYNTYASYAPGGFNGPLRAIDWRWWAGVAPYSPTYAYRGYGTPYTAGYAPAYSGYGYTTTANYFGPANYATTSYYAPSYGSAISYYPSSVIPATNACCSSCGASASATGSSCPGGNCGMNYQPVPQSDLSPTPDNSSDNTTGAKNFKNKSDAVPGFGGDPGASGKDVVPANDGTTGPGGATTPGGDAWDPYTKPGATNGISGESSRKANFPPAEGIKKTAPVPGEEATDPKVAPKGAVDEPEANLMRGPALEPEAMMPLVNRDARISEAPEVRLERRRLSARFGSPQLARAEAQPNAIPDTRDLRIVQK